MLMERHKSRSSHAPKMRSVVLEKIRQRILLSWSTLWYNSGIAGRLSLGLNLVLLCWCIMTISTYPFGCCKKATTWHGGHPEDERSGTCWCGNADQYCMCTPNLAIDLVVAGRTSSNKDEEFVWLVRRKDTSQLATMGGFVQMGETVEQAVHRELMEEMNLDFTDDDSTMMWLLGVYSDPRRDNRRHTVGVVYVVHFGDNASLHPQAADDVKDVQQVYLKDVEQHEYFADHYTILQDYKQFIQDHSPLDHSYFTSVPAIHSPGDFAPDIVRSLC